MTHESRGPILAALLVAMALPFLMPADYSPGARWLLPLVEGALLVAAISVDPGGIDRRSGHMRRLRIGIVMIIAFGAAWATSWLAVDLVRGENVTVSAGELLAAGSLVFLYLVIALASSTGSWTAAVPAGERVWCRATPTWRFPSTSTPTSRRPAGARCSWTTCTWGSPTPSRSARPT